MLEHLDKVPTFVQSLQFTVKDPTVGKAATFVKVDHVIQEIKKLMNIINKNVTTCFDCANKVSKTKCYIQFLVFLKHDKVIMVNIFWVQLCIHN